MKKRLAMVLALMMLSVTVLAGCGSNEDAASEDTQTEEQTDAAEVINEEKAVGDTFVVGFDAEFPPYGYRDDNGDYVGFDLSLAQEVCDRNDWVLELQPIDWDAKDMELGSGTIDCIWNGFTMTGREDEYTWSEAYIDNSQVIVVAEGSGIESFEDLAGKMVEVQADSSALAALEGDQADLAATFANLTQVADYNTAFMDLESGAADAVAMDIGVANYQISSRNGGYVVLDGEIATEQYAVGFNKGNEKLRDQVQATLDEMAADGTILRIAQEWDAKQDEVNLEDSLCLGK